MRQRGITNVIVMGVHENMCIVNRPFGIRQMVYQGQNVVLMRDMTDTMYDPQQKPYVDHFTGTDLMTWHIEKYWCPTITSDQIIGGSPFRFAADTNRAPRSFATTSNCPSRTHTTNRSGLTSKTRPIPITARPPTPPAPPSGK